MISIVIPVFNEEDCIEQLYLQLVSVLSGIEMDYEIIFVDDGSTDDSVNLIKALNQSNHNVKLVQFSKNFGHHRPNCWALR